MPFRRSYGTKRRYSRFSARRSYRSKARTSRIYGQFRKYPKWVEFYRTNNATLGNRGTFHSKDGNWYNRGGEASVARYGTTAQDATAPQRYQRQLDGFRGAGDYGTYLKYGARALGGLVGGIRGFRRSGARGLISGVRRGISRANEFVGEGDYEEGSGVPAAVQTYGPAVDNQLIAGGNPPMSVNSSCDLSGDVCFSHREFVTNVFATGTPTGISAFTNTALALNPGLSAVFPWLSQIAASFTMWKFDGCIWEYIPTTGEMGNATNQLGKIIMATDYDPDAVPFSNSRTMENYDYATASKPSLVARHGVETARAQSFSNMLYVRTGPSTKNKIFTDVGLFQIATEGLPVPNGSVAQVGELYVNYRVRLSRAQLTQGLTTLFGMFASTPPVGPAEFFGPLTRKLLVIRLVSRFSGPTFATINFPITSRNLTYYFSIQVDTSTPPVAGLTPEFIPPVVPADAVLQRYFNNPVAPSNIQNTFAGSGIAPLFGSAVQTFVITFGSTQTSVTSVTIDCIGAPVPVNYNLFIVQINNASTLTNVH